MAEFKIAHSRWLSDEGINRHVVYLRGGRLYLGPDLVKEFWLSEPLEVKMGDGIRIPLLVDKPPIVWEESNGGISADDCDCRFIISISKFADSEIKWQGTTRFCMGDLAN
ncbi:hypothetical protein KQI84_07975 [bacterium]|nr:hypothetical protein [bacterium]